MGVAVRIAGLIALVVAVPVIIDGSTASWIAAIVLTVLVGALIARWWALLAPIGIAVISRIVDGSSTEVDAMTVALAFAVVLAVGIGLGKLARLARKPATRGVAGRGYG